MILKHDNKLSILLHEKTIFGTMSVRLLYIKMLQNSRCFDKILYLNRKNFLNRITECGSLPMSISELIEYFEIDGYKKEPE